MARFKDFLQAAKIPLLALGVVVVLYGVWVLLDLPPREELIEILRGLIERYGYAIVLVGAFLESLLFVGMYFPGSIIIFLSVILAPSLGAAVVSVLLVTLGLYTGYVTNFFLGKYGWHKLLTRLGVGQQLAEAKKALTRYGGKAILVGYWSPGLAAFISTAAGVLHYPLRRFFVYSLVAVVLWDTFWGTVVYLLGERALNVFMNWWFVLAAVVLWIALRYLERRVEHKVVE